MERSNVTRALGRLEEWRMLQRADTGLIFVNPLLGFEGNGDVQQEILEALRNGAAEGAFPEVKPPPAPRSVQLGLAAEDGDDEVSTRSDRHADSGEHRFRNDVPTGPHQGRDEPPERPHRAPGAWR
ncbi:hypothetical protein ACFVWZ_15315 [Streptomyces sp. NPDC058200]|uniref:hypothetical protein n=1 Tax=Streptomyces sp. NPDC058200 TaxID=3346378 RepID=UPI0036E78ADD